MQETTTDGTIAQVLLALGEIKVQIAVMDTKLSALPDYEQRIRVLERFRYMLVGVSLVVGLIEGAVGYWIGHVVH